MRNIITCLLLASVIYSCAPAKIATISSTNVQTKNSGFVYENDTVRIMYRFWAENGIMDFDIYNKMDNPIYFDWKNSAFIPNDQMVSYWQDVTNTVGSSSSASSWLYGGTVVTKGASKSVRQERIGVIPPHSLITRSDFKLIKSNTIIPKAGIYSKENSFLNFRNYLMFCTNEKFEGKIMAVDNQFYVSQLLDIKANKKDNFITPDRFFIKLTSYK